MYHIISTFLMYNKLHFRQDIMTDLVLVIVEEGHCSLSDLLDIFSGFPLGMSVQLVLTLRSWNSPIVHCMCASHFSVSDSFFFFFFHMWEYTASSANVNCLGLWSDVAEPLSGKKNVLKHREDVWGWLMAVGGAWHMHPVYSGGRGFFQRDTKLWCGLLNIIVFMNPKPHNNTFNHNVK